MRGPVDIDSLLQFRPPAEVSSECRRRLALARGFAMDEIRRILAESSGWFSDRARELLIRWAADDFIATCHRIVDLDVLGWTDSAE